MIITDKDNFGWALGDCSHISLARVLLEEFDNTYYIGFSFKGKAGYHQIPFATKEEAETVLKQIDEKMKHSLMCAHSAKPVDNTLLEKSKEYYEKAKQAEERGKHYYEEAYRILRQQPVPTYNPFMQQPNSFVSTIARNTGGMAPKTE